MQKATALIDTEDLRRHRLILTPAGLAAITAARNALAARYDVRLARLQSSDRADFERLLKRLAESG